MALHRLGGLLFLNSAETELHSIIAVALDSLILKYDAGAGLNDRYRNNLALLGEDLRHTKFLT